jgi:hypothetical protein
VWTRGSRTSARWYLIFHLWGDQEKMVFHTVSNGTWKTLYTCIVSFPFLFVLTCILVVCLVLVSWLCINHGRLATLFMIALWSCIPILLYFVWYRGGWYIWTSCHTLWFPSCGNDMLFIHIIFCLGPWHPLLLAWLPPSCISCHASFVTILVVDLCELVSCLCLVLESCLACCSLVFFCARIFV